MIMNDIKQEQLTDEALMNAGLYLDVKFPLLNGDYSSLIDFLADKLTALQVEDATKDMQKPITGANLKLVEKNTEYLKGMHILSMQILLQDLSSALKDCDGSKFGFFWKGAVSSTELTLDMFKEFFDQELQYTLLEDQKTYLKEKLAFLKGDYTPLVDWIMKPTVDFLEQGYNDQFGFLQKSKDVAGFQHRMISLELKKLYEAFDLGVPAEINAQYKTLHKQNRVTFRLIEYYFENQN